MPDLKNAWKETGKGLGGAFKGLGKTLINSTKKGADKAVEWAGRGNGEKAAEAQPTEAQPEAAPEVQAAAEAEEKVSAADEIRKLTQLRNEGILTEEEFAAKKAQLLGL